MFVTTPPAVAPTSTIHLTQKIFHISYSNMNTFLLKGLRVSQPELQKEHILLFRDTPLRVSLISTGQACCPFHGRVFRGTCSILPQLPESHDLSLDSWENVLL